jgi:taurine transport system substrate-binding protein
MTIKSKLLGTIGAASVALSAQAAVAGGHGEITVAYFLEWPMPFEYAKQMGTYDEELGVKVNWVSFESGVKMSAAMASGDVHLSVSQGVPPFVVAASAGQDLQILDVAVSYADNDNCVVKSDLEIDKDSAAELAGKKSSRAVGNSSALRFPQTNEPFWC